MKKFEYLIEKYHNPITDNDLNDKGLRGWKLISAILDSSIGYIYYFKQRLK